MPGRYFYRRDKWSLWSLWVLPMMLMGVVAALVVTSAGSYYTPASVAALGGALLALVMLSIPRYVEVKNTEIRIVCLLEITIVRADEIKQIDRLDALPLGKAVPVAAMLGFGGYYGYWFSLSEWSLHKIYATHRQQCLVIKRYRGCDIIISIN